MKGNTGIFTNLLIIGSSNLVKNTKSKVYCKSKILQDFGLCKVHWKWVLLIWSVPTLKGIILIKTPWNPVNIVQFSFKKIFPFNNAVLIHGHDRYTPVLTKKVAQNNNFWYAKFTPI